MLRFCSIHQLRRSSPLSKFSFQSNQICAGFTCHNKPSSTTLLRNLTSTSGGESVKDCSGVTNLDDITKGVVRLECKSSAEGGVCHVYLVGTIHISEKSCKEVKDVIRYVTPQAVFLELCRGRAKVSTHSNFKAPTVSEMVELWKNKGMDPFRIFVGWFYATLSRELEVRPGEEFRVAYQEAIRIAACVYLGDRPVHVYNFQESMEWHNTVEHTKSLYHIIFTKDFWKLDTKMLSQLEYWKEVFCGDPYKQWLNMKLKEFEDEDTLAAYMQEMHKAFPSLTETLITERDKYMSYTLWTVARKHSSVVAVVGKGHLSGIKKYWMQPVEVENLLEVPSEKEDFSISKILASVRAITDLVVGIYHRPRK